MRAVEQAVAERATRIHGEQDAQRRFARVGRQRGQLTLIIAGFAREGSGRAPAAPRVAAGIAAARVGRDAWAVPPIGRGPPAIGLLLITQGAAPSY